MPSTVMNSHSLYLSNPYRPSTTLGLKETAITAQHDLKGDENPSPLLKRVVKKKKTEK
jgi:hypothetical protein